MQPASDTVTEVARNLDPKILKKERRVLVGFTWATLVGLLHSALVFPGLPQLLAEDDGDQLFGRVPQDGHDEFP